MKLTTTTIKTLALPAGVRDKTYFDDSLGGFGLRLREGGAARWVVQYDLGGKTKRVTLGTTAMLELGAARAKAKDMLAAVRLGGDPAAEKRQAHERASESFGALLARYLPHKQAQLKTGSRSFKEVERHLTKYARSLHARPVTAIDRRTIAALVATIASKNGPTAANCMLGSLSGYFGWLIREGLISDVNPASYVNKAAAKKSRERVLTAEEFREIWNALGDSDYADIFRLLALTGARKSEIGGLRWDEIDLGNAVVEIPASRMKANRPHVIPLSGPALEILRRRPRTGDYVFGRGRGFQGWSARRKALDAAIGSARPDFVLHDLRRLASTVMHEKLGIQPHIVERVLAHVGHQRGVAGTYNKAEYLAERRRALVRWADYVLAVVTGEESTALVVLLMK